MKHRLDMIARSPRLLIACDFDGTLAPIVRRPDRAAAEPDALDALDRAAALPQTCVAILTGRALADIRGRIPGHHRFWLAGGHGADVAGPGDEPTGGEPLPIIRTLLRTLAEVAPTAEGFVLEPKPTSVAVHYRDATAEAAARVVAHLEANVAGPAGLHVKHGKKVVELLAVDADKGRALRAIREATGAMAVLYVGDDVTDEDAFKVLTDADLGVKVGAPPTAAEMTVPDVAAVIGMLDELCSMRQRWAVESRRAPIHHHALLSDQRTVALVAPDARVCWLCLPRADSGAVFAELVDGPGAGYLSTTPAEARGPSAQSYVGDTFILRTEWPGLTVTDYLDASGGRPFQRAGRSDLVRVIEGRGRARIEFAPRPEFGRLRSKLVVRPDGIVVEGPADPLVLVAPGVTWTIQEREGRPVAAAEVEVSDRALVLELRSGTRSLEPSRVAESSRREQTSRVWSSWVASLKTPGLYGDLCRRSALALRALAYGPSGAMLAAATTSLPETAGGVRNWDYRFCWPRDAAVASAALVRLGNTGTAMRFLDWLLGVVDHCAGPERLRPIYTVTGAELGTEAELSDLAGYLDSRPVRVGNAAAQQVQLDVFGPIVDLVWLLAQRGAPISPDHWRLVEAMATAVERSWTEPDHGIWEIRTEKRHHTHTKVMCWLALDRAIRVGEQFEGARRESWVTLRETIHRQVMERAWDASLGAFIAAYDQPEIDAAVLTIGLSGMLPPDDPRLVSTVEAVTGRLLDRDTVYRYRYADGLPGPEGGFHLCTGWLIESLALMGRREQSKRLLDRLASCAGPTGLLSEQWCPEQDTALGNFPQAYSHAAIINAAVALGD